MIKAVIFDVDNTLLSFDGYVKECMKNGFPVFGIKEYKEEMFEVFARINDSLWLQIERKEITFEELQRVRWNLIFEQLGIEADGIEFEAYFREYLNVSAIPMEGALELLNHLKGRYRLYIASNGPYDQQINRLKLSGMLPYFSEVFISQKIGYSKPDPLFFNYCLDHINRNEENKILPEEILMVGDSLSSDIAGGKTVGMKTCFLDIKGTGKGNADWTVSSLSEIGKII